MLAVRLAIERDGSLKGCVMTRKAITAVLILALAGALAIGLRSTNRADAAEGNCYAADKGPDTPTICS
jgi:hypothetical protein